VVSECPRLRQGDPQCIFSYCNGTWQAQ
jgi:hypothetical protein